MIKERNFLKLLAKSFSMSVNKTLNSENQEIEYDDVVKTTNKEIYSNIHNIKEMDIEILKEKGLRGDELIKTILDTNKSMDKRTVLSQEKIMKKKERKYKHKVWITPTNLFNVVETFFLDELKKIK